MKRVSGLFGRAVAFSSLYAAAQRAFRANRDNREALEFMFNLEPELLSLQRELLNGQYQPGKYRIFTIRDPKVRTICAAPFRDRVVHHAVCAALEPHFEGRYIYDSYACRPRKGMHRALLRARRYLRHYRYFLKCDVQKYFASVDQSILKTRLRRVIKDPAMLCLLDCIIDAAPPGTSEGRGIPIGNLTSQHFANFYLDQHDHLVKEELRIPGYVRYMDDFICFSDDRDLLHGTLAEVRHNLWANLRLRLKDKACYVAPNTQGLPFLGFRLYPNHLRLRRQALVRCRRKLRARQTEYEAGQIDEETFVQSVSSLLEYIRNGDTRVLRRTWFAAMEG